MFCIINVYIQTYNHHFPTCMHGMTEGRWTTTKPTFGRYAFAKP